MSEVQLLVVWFVIPAPIILLWVFLTNREYPIKDKLCSLLIGELFGVVSAIFIVLIWVDMLVEKVEKFVPDNFRHIAKEHNIGDARTRAGIKLGDEVWFFSNDEIKKGRLREDHSNFVDVVVREVNAAGRVVFGHYYPNTNSIFPSREALCEHYRKIFK